jgi:glutamyl-Q tRNA(Asp) synthetase
LGHAYSALCANDLVREMGGQFLLRIEDTDSTRCKPEFTDGIFEDLSWLGLNWPSPRIQSEHYPTYWQAIDQLDAMGLIFPCSCPRREVEATGLGLGPDGPIYPGTCCNKSLKDARPADALRLNLRKAQALLPQVLQYEETGDGTQKTCRFITHDITPQIGAPVLRRRETGDPAYHLACVVDDAVQQVTHVVRGADVAPLTPIHLVLQALLELPTPVYYHHPLITDETGKRLAKISQSKAIATYRAQGVSALEMRRMVGLDM